MEIILYQAPRPTEKVRAQEWRTTGWAGVSSSTLGLKKGLKIAGTLLLAVSLLGLSAYFFPLAKAEFDYHLLSQKNSPVSQFGLIQAMPTDAIVPPDINFSLVVPKIGAQSPVIANVNTYNEKKYNEALKKGIAHGAGSVFPGMKGTIWLFAHSSTVPWEATRYHPVFYLLKEMEEGDPIVVFFQGKRFNYTVYDKKVVERVDTAFLDQKDNEILVLQTCWPPGTAKQALLVFARPAKA